MSLLQRFAQFSQLPQDIRDDIWTRLLSGAHINFVTIAEGAHTSPDDAETQRSLVSPMTDGWGRYSTRTQIQEIAAACRDAHRNVARLLQAWKAGTAQRGASPLWVIVPEKRQAGPGDVGMPTGQMSPFLGLGQPSAVAVLFVPGSGNSASIQPLRDGTLPGSVRTVYVLDMASELRLRARVLRDLQISAGPWYGHRYAFVDLDPNPVTRIMAESDPPELACEIMMLDTVLLRLRAHYLQPDVRVRMLTPVLLD